MSNKTLEKRISALGTQCLNLQHQVTAAQNHIVVLRGEIGRLQRIIKIYEAQIAAAGRAPSLNRCKKALREAIDNVKDYVIQEVKTVGRLNEAPNYRLANTCLICRHSKNEIDSHDICLSHPVCTHYGSEVGELCTCNDFSR